MHQVQKTSIPGRSLLSYTLVLFNSASLHEDEKREAPISLSSSPSSCLSVKPCSQIKRWSRRPNRIRTPNPIPTRNRKSPWQRDVRGSRPHRAGHPFDSSPLHAAGPFLLLAVSHLCTTQTARKENKDIFSRLVRKRKWGNTVAYGL